MMKDDPPGETPTEQGHKPRLIDRIRHGREGRPRRRRLKTTMVLPAMLTLGNALSGFASIHFATKDGLGEAKIANLALAAWLILASMIFDMLDGRVARFSRQATDFGGQLDTLSDVVSFGVAPAVLMLRTTVFGMRHLTIPAHGLAVERVVWCIAAAYFACATLRLARFNVENTPEESSHMDFRGLPVPGAAAPIMTLVLLLKSMLARQWISPQYLLATASVVLPIVGLSVAMLMVSRIPYLHVVNQYIRGKKKFEYIVKLLALVLIAVLQPFVAGVVFAFGFALSGPLTAIRARRRVPKPVDQGPDQSADQTPQGPADVT